MNEIETARDCALALLLGVGANVIMWAYALWRVYKDCQP